MLIKIFVLVALIGLSAFFSSSESAFFSLGRMRARRLLRFGYEKFIAAEKLLQNPTELISTLLIGNEIVNTAFQVVGTAILYEFFKGRFSGNTITLMSVVVLLPTLLLFGEIIPKTFGIRATERVAARNARPLLFFSNLIQPIRKTLSFFPRFILQKLNKNYTPNTRLNEEALRSMLDTSAKDGIVNDQEQKLIHNVFKLDDLKVSQIMTSKNAVSFLKKGDLITTAVEKFKSDSYSRFPVVDPKEDKIIGVIYAKDLIGKTHLNEGTIDKYLRQPLIVSKDTNALILFSQFKTFRMHFATVVEPERDTWLGVVTFEDVLEEIFGDIRDERDVDEERKKR